MYIPPSDFSPASGAVVPWTSTPEADLLLEVDFKWLMAGQGCWVDPQRLLLARDGRAHAFFHHRIQQCVLALEVVERRAAAHAHGGGHVARGGGLEALAAKQPGGGFQQLAAAVAVISLVGGLARAAARALGQRGFSCGIGLGQGGGVHGT